MNLNANKIAAVIILIAIAVTTIWGFVGGWNYSWIAMLIGVIAQKLISMHDKYCVDIYQPAHEKTVVAILITLQHMIRDRENARSSSSGSSSHN